ncbi:MAG TPA: PAS domain-containing protein, partial [Acidimicrobiales bacterium]|nr:PAS domain-containing protein [Acidimicrobiales bacterium]
MSDLADLLRPLAEDGLGSLGVLLDQLDDGIAVFDSDWNVVWLNRTGARLLQRPASELIGRNLWATFPGSEETQVYREYHRAVAEQREIEFEVLYGPLGGWFEVRAIPTPGGLLALYRNVT